MSENIFVKNFTTVERHAVDKLKSDLPAILQSALGSSDPYPLWGVALDKDSTDERLDVILVKFVRARDNDVAKATKMLTDMLTWRKAFKTDTILEETFDEEVFGGIGYIWKTDKNGRPVCYNFYGDLDQDVVFADPDKFIRWRVQLMEKGVKLLDFKTVDSMIQIHDYHNASMFGRSGNSKAATKEIIKIMQDNYPEFLAVKFFVNVPWWGSLIFKLVRPLLSEATVKKFVVCSNDELVQTLTTAIDYDNLPDSYKKADQTEKPKDIATTEGAAEQPAAESSAEQPAPKEETPADDTKPSKNVTDAPEVPAPEVPAPAATTEASTSGSAPAPEQAAEKVPEAVAETKDKQEDGKPTQ